MEHFPGNTAGTASSEVLNQLREGQQVDYYIEATPPSIFTLLGIQGSGNISGEPTVINRNGNRMYLCKLQRVEPADLSIPILVNDVRMELPALHAKCTLNDEEETHFYFLDQPSNAIILISQIGPADSRTQVVKITYAAPEDRTSSRSGGGAPMEQALAAKKPVEVYGIYFDFDSATIRPESEAVLQQIAGLLRKNQDWKLSLSGHTDNIGDDKFNLGLSQRRAAAVKDALVTQYNIASDRLATSGYGASRPIETNATTEGRARNRRVELQRQ